MGVERETGLQCPDPTLTLPLPGGGNSSSTKEEGVLQEVYSKSDKLISFFT